MQRQATETRAFHQNPEIVHTALEVVVIKKRKYYTLQQQEKEKEEEEEGGKAIGYFFGPDCIPETFSESCMY